MNSEFLRLDGFDMTNRYWNRPCAEAIHGDALD